MSMYTMPLRAYIEKFSQYEEGLSVRERIEKGRPYLFDFDYPIFDETYKKVFETHFIREFYFREIGFETESQFKFRLETWLLINMPYFNKLFESELIQYDPLRNTEVDTDHLLTKDRTQNDTKDRTINTTGTSNTTSSGTSNQDNFGREISSDNPDSRLNLTTNDGEGVIEYASEIDERTENSTETADSTTDQDVTNDETGNETLSSTINDTEDYINHRVGKIGVQSYAKMIQEHRQAFLRIERDIFSEMQQLFMLVY